VLLRGGRAPNHSGAVLRERRLEAPEKVAGDTYVLYAGVHRIAYPHTPDPLSLQLCAVIRCRSFPVCPPYQTASHAVFDSWALSLTDRSPRSDDYLVIPTAATRDGSPVSTDADLRFDTDGRGIQADHWHRSLFAASIQGWLPVSDASDFPLEDADGEGITIVQTLLLTRGRRDEQLKERRKAALRRGGRGTARVSVSSRAVKR